MFDALMFDALMFDALMFDALMFDALMFTSLVPALPTAVLPAALPLWELPADVVRTLVESVQKFVGDYGWAIVLVALGLRLILLPLTIAQRRASVLLRRLGPEIERLRREHAGDREAFRRAQVALLRERQFNPLAGCLSALAIAGLCLALGAALYNMPALQGVAPFGGRTWIGDLARPDRLVAFGERLPLLGSHFHLLPWLPALLALLAMLIPRLRRGTQNPPMAVFGLAAVGLFLYHLPSTVWLALLPFFAVNAIEFALIPLPPQPGGDREGGTPPGEAATTDHPRP